MISSVPEAWPCICLSARSHQQSRSDLLSAYVPVQQFEQVSVCMKEGLYTWRDLLQQNPRRYFS
jgi:hypothetical protein